MLQNGLLVLVAPNFETDRRNVKRRTECLSDVFLRVFAEERWHILHKFIDEVHRRAAIDRFLSFAAAQQTLMSTSMFIIDNAFVSCQCKINYQICTLQ